MGCSQLAAWRVMLQAYGKTTYLITSLQLVPRGTEGAVSLEGTAAGLAAALLYAAVALGLGQVSPAPPLLLEGLKVSTPNILQHCTSGDGATAAVMHSITCTP